MLDTLQSSQPITSLVLTNKKSYWKICKLNKLKAMQNTAKQKKLPWFSRLFWHSARKRDELILECSRAHWGDNLGLWNLDSGRQEKSWTVLNLLVLVFSQFWYVFWIMSSELYRTTHSLKHYHNHAWTDPQQQFFSDKLGDILSCISLVSSFSWYI